MRAYNEPANWWGWHWEPSVPLSVIEIIKAGSMSARLAALFWMCMERGASLIIASSPPSSGKTTTLSALMGFLPEEAGAYFTRGVGETFDLPPPGDSQPLYILVNEISDHLPVYTWGTYARRAFEFMAQGYSLGSTMHADTAKEVVQILEEDLRIPRAHIAQLTFIAAIDLSYEDAGGRRRMNEVSFQRPDAAGGLEMIRVAEWEPRTDSYRVLESVADRAPVAEWAGLDVGAFTAELERRQAFLEGLLQQDVTAIPQVREAIESYGGRQTPAPGP